MKKETTNLDKSKEKTKIEFYPREEICPVCGKKYICYGYSQTMCLQCSLDYVCCTSD